MTELGFCFIIRHMLTTNDISTLNPIQISNLWNEKVPYLKTEQLIGFTSDPYQYRVGALNTNNTNSLQQIPTVHYFKPVKDSPLYKQMPNTIEKGNTGPLVTRRNIWVTFSREGIHRYPAALTDPKLATKDYYDVSFLGHPHRHIFNFKVWISVSHSDRDIEFIQFKRWLNSLYDNGILQLDYKSCEMIADDLYLNISKKYPNRNVRIQVDEDGENGCEVEYTNVVSLC